MSDINKIFISILLFVLTACNDAFCLDADDFGFSHVKVAATSPVSEYKGSNDRQYIDWQDSGLRLSGNNLTMIVKSWEKNKNVNNSSELSAWCPWLGPSHYPPSLAYICIFFDDCKFKDNKMCTDGSEADIINAPCLMRDGVGLYYLLAPPGFDPNETEESSRTPHLVNSKVIYGHLGDKQYNSFGDEVPFYDIQIDPFDERKIHNIVDGTNDGNDVAQLSRMVKVNGARLDLTPAQKLNLKGGKLYFKILDNYYQDNSGQYIVTVKTGVTDSEWDPMDFVVNMVREFFFGKKDSGFLDSDKGVIANMFTSVITNPSYKMAVSSLLTFSIILYAFNFLIGNVQVTHMDLLVRILKILIVSQLLMAETAWTVLNDYFFKFFVNGTEEIIGIIRESGGTGTGPTSILGFLLSPITVIKLFALPFVGGVGQFFASWLYILLYLASIAIIFLGMCYSGIVYVTCLVMIGLLIALAPIFFCFILFDATKSLFDTWLKQIASYALQPLIVVAAVSMFGVMIKHQVYSTLGFKVCKWEFIKFAPTENAYSRDVQGNDERSFRPYFFVPRYDKNEQKTNILIPEGHFEGGNNILSNTEKIGRYCAPYECEGERYLSFPFLDPDDPNDLEVLNNMRRGVFIFWPGILLLLGSGVMLLLFMTQALRIGQFITGGQMDITRTTTNTFRETADATIATTRNAGKFTKFVGKSMFKGIRGVMGSKGRAKDGDSVSSKKDAGEDSVSSKK